MKAYAFSRSHALEGLVIGQLASNTISHWSVTLVSRIATLKTRSAGRRRGGRLAQGGECNQGVQQRLRARGP